MLKKGWLCRMRAGKFSLGLVSSQSRREGSAWSICKVETASIHCLLRTVKRKGKERGRVLAVHADKATEMKEFSFSLALVLVFCLYSFKMEKTWHVYMMKRGSHGGD